ncbi:SURF1 family cytochrome oxidase biogenesis protein [Leucobacter sp. 1207-22]|uniref:SURF1 family cytochrome oxidase biogenesis protein n=1 Tax=Leucobacter sp. 1207-22 TaxID=2604456 RepID=UPI00406412A9
MARKTPEYLGEPTLGQVMRRPQWILALLLALAVAAAFAWLGRWQLGTAIRSDVSALADTETVKSLTELAKPGGGLNELAAGSVVEIDGTLVPGDFNIVEKRQNDGVEGVWVVGRFATEDPASNLSAAIGWAPTASDASQAIALLEATVDPTQVFPLEGRMMPAEAPARPGADQDPHLMTAMVPAQLINTWGELNEPVYAGYMVLHPQAEMSTLLDAAGLDAIDSVPPSEPEQVNWLNLFYAVEWVVFAGFAVFFWFRLTRDAWEKEHELKALAEQARVDAE